VRTLRKPFFAFESLICSLFSPGFRHFFPGTDWRLKVVCGVDNLRGGWTRII
jgi:hypothetical protein